MQVSAREEVAALCLAAGSVGRKEQAGRDTGLGRCWRPLQRLSSKFTEMGVVLCQPKAREAHGMSDCPTHKQDASFRTSPADCSSPAHLRE